MLPFNELWDRRFLNIAREVSSWSKDPSTQVGAVLVNEWRRIISTGYNGFPANLADDPEKLLDRQYKLENIIHAEINCLNNLTDNPLEIQNGVLTVKLHELYGIADGCCLYTWPLLPCPVCADIIANAGVIRVVSIIPTIALNKRWQLQKSLDVFNNYDVECLEVYYYD